jgi:hypothetical protein
MSIFFTVIILNSNEKEMDILPYTTSISSFYDLHLRESVDILANSVIIISVLVLMKIGFSWMPSVTFNNPPNGAAVEGA